LAARSPLEAKVGGPWYEIGVDGTECDCGRVTAYEPDRVAVAWHLDGAWQYDPDPEHASEFEVRFVAEGPNSTRVELEHQNFERHGASADGVHGGVDSLQGWDYCLDRFSKALA
jgi:Activator of Hsp90 ATPase homolog 1-like protein